MPSLSVESLEQRALLAVTATLSGADLQISLGAADDVAYLSNDGTNYIVRGTGLSGFAVSLADVDAVAVAGTAAANQSFTVAAGVGAVLTDSLSVAASVEVTTVVGAIDTVGTVTIGSGLTTLAADVISTGKQDYQGDVGLVGDRTLSSGAADISFAGKVDSSALLFADPDAFATGTTLTNAYPGITLSDAGSSNVGVVVTSKSSDVVTPTSGFYAPTGNRVFAGGGTVGPSWNAPGTVFKAAFASTVTSVSLDFASNDEFDPNAYIEAYDSLGNLVAAATYADAILPLSLVTLTVSAPDIAYVLASFDPIGGNDGLVDNLRATLAVAPAASLTANSSGATTFGGAVGGTTPLASLTTDKGGTASLESVTTTGAQTYNDAAVTLNGTYTTTDSAFTVANAATLAGNVSVDTGSGAGDISFGGTLDGGKTLGLTAGKGNVTFTGLVGDTTPLGAITVNSAANVTANGIRAASLSQVAGSGTTTLNGGTFTSAPALTEALRTTAAAGVSLTGTNLAVNGAIATANAGAVKLDESGTITIAAAGDITADDTVVIKALGGITTAGDVTTTDDDVDFESQTTLSGNVAVSTGSGAGDITPGDITFGGTLDGAKQATLAAGVGVIAFKAAVGSTTPLAGIKLSSAASTTAASTVALAKAADSAEDGFTVAAGVNNVTITSGGSSVTGFARDGISFLGGSTNSRLSGFTVSGNGSNGINFAAGSYGGTTLTANTIRDNGDKTTHLGDGILVRGSNLMIGWDATPETVTAVQNTITGNALNGIRITGKTATGNTILSNTIFLNGYVADGVVVGEGISLTDQGNDGQAAPRILDVVRDNVNTADPVVHVQFVIDAAGSYLVQFFSNTGDNDTSTEGMDDDRGLFPADENGFEGRTFVAEAPLSTIATAGVGKPVIQPVGGSQVVTGNSLQTITIPASLLSAGSWLTATATRLAETTPLATSGFSSAVEVTAAPVLAVGADGSSSMWNREYTFRVRTANSIAVTGLTAAELTVFSAKNALNGTPVILTIDGKNVTGRVTGAGASQGTLAVALALDGGASLAGGTGTLVLGGASLPAARLYDVSVPDAAPVLSIGAGEIAASLKSAVLAAGGKSAVSDTQIASFVNRFQGGLRVTSNDFDGDGFVDLVTAPGGVPARPGSKVPGTAVDPAAPRQKLSDAFGAAARIITVYNGNPNTRGAWTSASLDVSGEFAGECGGFLVTVGNVRAEAAGSGSAVAELIVASSSKVRVYEVEVATRGAKPTFRIPDSQAEIKPAGVITGVVAGRFSSTTRDDILVATTTATSSLFVRTPGASGTAKVHAYKAGSSFAEPSSSFVIDSRVQNADPRKGGVQQNVFFFGATLAVGDIDNAIDQKQELVLGARENGLGNFRALANDVVADAIAGTTGFQSRVNQALSNTGTYSQPARSSHTAVSPGASRWQPSGGPDYFVGYGNVPLPLGLGFGAPVSLAVVESNGRDFKAEVFAALGTGNQTASTVRQFTFQPAVEASRGSWAVGNNAPLAFTMTAGGTRLTLAGDQRHSIQPGQALSIKSSGNPELSKQVRAVEYQGGNTVVTLDSKIDATTTAGTLVGNWLNVNGDPAEAATLAKTRFGLGGGLRLG